MASLPFILSGCSVTSPPDHSLKHISGPQQVDEKGSGAAAGAYSGWCSSQPTEKCDFLLDMSSYHGPATTCSFISLETTSITHVSVVGFGKCPLPEAPSNVSISFFPRSFSQALSPVGLQQGFEVISLLQYKEYFAGESLLATPEASGSASNASRHFIQSIVPLTKKVTFPGPIKYLLLRCFCRWLPIKRLDIISLRLLTFDEASHMILSALDPNSQPKLNDKRLVEVGAKRVREWGEASSGDGLQPPFFYGSSMIQVGSSAEIITDPVNELYHKALYINVLEETIFDSLVGEANGQPYNDVMDENHNNMQGANSILSSLSPTWSHSVPFTNTSHTSITKSNDAVSNQEPALFNDNTLAINTRTPSGGASASQTIKQASVVADESPTVQVGSITNSESAMKYSEEANQPLAGVVFVLSGFQGQERSSLRDAAKALGATYCSKWEPRICTHLVTASELTQKVAEVRKATIRPHCVFIVGSGWIKQAQVSRSRPPEHQFGFPKLQWCLEAL